MGWIWSAELLHPAWPAAGRLQAAQGVKWWIWLAVQARTLQPLWAWQFTPFFKILQPVLIWKSTLTSCGVRRNFLNSLLRQTLSMVFGKTKVPVILYVLLCCDSPQPSKLIDFFVHYTVTAFYEIQSFNFCAFMNFQRQLILTVHQKAKQNKMYQLRKYSFLLAKPSKVFFSFLNHSFN